MLPGHQDKVGKSFACRKLTMENVVVLGIVERQTEDTSQGVLVVVAKDACVLIMCGIQIPTWYNFLDVENIRFFTCTTCTTCTSRLSYAVLSIAED